MEHKVSCKQSYKARRICVSLLLSGGEPRLGLLMSGVEGLLPQAGWCLGPQVRSSFDFQAHVGSPVEAM